MGNIKQIKINEIEKQNISQILLDLLMLLENSGNYAQARYIESLSNSLVNDKNTEFVYNLKSAEMWGGSGSVWEVAGFEDNEKQKQFWMKLIQLVETTQKVGIKNSDANSVAEICRRLLTK